jgi:hypothetical protein
MSENFNNILADIKKSNSGIPVDCTNEVVTIKPLTLSQQKTVIDSNSDPLLGAVFFNTVFYKIIKENTDIGVVNRINTIDRVKLALALRKYIQDEVEIDDDTTVKISDIIEHNKDTELLFETKTVTSGDYIFEVTAPNLEHDNKVNAFLLKKHSGKDDYNDLIGDLYVHELAKFITCITINDNQFKCTSVAPTVELLGAIDTKHFKDVKDYINDVRGAESQLTHTGNEKNAISITPEFFIV